jgi:hypothetical protein
MVSKDEKSRIRTEISGRIECPNCSTSLALISELREMLSDEREARASDAQHAAADREALRALRMPGVASANVSPFGRVPAASREVARAMPMDIAARLMADRVLGRSLLDNQAPPEVTQEQVTDEVLEAAAIPAVAEPGA